MAGNLDEVFASFRLDPFDDFEVIFGYPNGEFAEVMVIHIP